MTEVKLKIEPEILIYNFDDNRTSSVGLIGATIDESKSSLDAAGKPHLYLYRGAGLVSKFNCVKLMKTIDKNYRRLRVSIYCISKRRFVIKFSKNATTKAIFLLDLRLEAKAKALGKDIWDTMKPIHPPFKRYTLGYQDMDNFTLVVDERVVHLMSIGDHDVVDVTYTHLSDSDNIIIHTGRVYKGAESKKINVETNQFFSHDGYISMILYDKYVVGDVTKTSHGNPPSTQSIIRDTTTGKEIKIKADGLICSSDSYDQVVVSSIYDSRRVYFISEDEMEMKRMIGEVGKFLDTSKHAALYTNGYNIMFALYEQPGAHLFTFAHDKGFEISGAISTWLIHEKECEERIAWLTENDVLPSGVRGLLMQYM